MSGRNSRRGGFSLLHPGNPPYWSGRESGFFDDDRTRMILDVDIPRDTKAPWHARRAVERLGDQIDEDVRPDVMLLVSELVTNSVKYGEDGGLKLQIEAKGPRKLRVEVVDQGGGFVPKARDRPVNEPGGWGLHLVEALTDRWGVYEGSTHVWFEIDR
ncbi:MAG TPA: ATP-binding protein [Solirubrobacteraceae bacterium]